MQSKSEYKSNRQLGKRGQGEEEPRKFTPTGEPTTFIINGEPKILNREQRRRRVIDKRYTRHTRKGSNPVLHPNGNEQYKPKYPSSITNNQRMKMREMNRMKAFEVK